MGTIKADRAVALLTEAVQKAPCDDLAELSNELFPEEPTTEDEVIKSTYALIARVVDHLQRGLEIEELVDLWHVVFPEHRGLWFDEDAGLFHYQEEPQPANRAEY